MRSNDDWNRAIAACIHEFDSNSELRLVWAKEDAEYLQDHAGDRKLCRMVTTRPEGAFVDPVRYIHPPAALLERIRKARQRLANVSAKADLMKEAALSRADKADSPYEKQMARDEVSKQFDNGTPDIIQARIEIEDALAKAGVYALSLRSPFTVREDTSRASRSSDAEEFQLFKCALQYTRDYPSPTRRALHAAKSADERSRISAEARLDCRARLIEAGDLKIRDARELEARRVTKMKVDQNVEQMGGICAVCGWAHQDDMTLWMNPSSGERHTIAAGTNRQKFLLLLHGQMSKNSGVDVSLASIMKQCAGTGKGQQPKDILGDKFQILFLGVGRDRGKIRPPDFKQPRGRPRMVSKSPLTTA